MTIVVFLTYFLLLSGQHFKRRLVELVGPRLERQLLALEISLLALAITSARRMGAAAGQSAARPVTMGSSTVWVIACDASSSRTVFSASGDAVGGDTAAAIDSSSG